nr:MAG TPA: hypothetical protein [Caudoviricetes sp.]DAY27876.1 MAG TPA: hypothetical protein [Caudoviricetes sp.]
MRPAVFSLYPAFIAACVAFPLAMYSSANFCCLTFNLLIFHHLFSFLSKNKDSLIDCRKL